MPRRLGEVSTEGLGFRMAQMIGDLRGNPGWGWMPSIIFTGRVMVMENTALPQKPGERNELLREVSVIVPEMRESVSGLLARNAVAGWLDILQDNIGPASDPSLGEVFQLWAKLNQEVRRGMKSPARKVGSTELLNIQLR